MLFSVVSTGRDTLASGGRQVFTDSNGQAFDELRASSEVLTRSAKVTAIGRGQSEWDGGGPHLQELERRRAHRAMCPHTVEGDGAPQAWSSRRDARAGAHAGSSNGTGRGELAGECTGLRSMALMDHRTGGNATQSLL